VRCAGRREPRPPTTSRSRANRPPGELAAALGALEPVQESQDPAAVAPVVVLAVDSEFVVDVEGRTLGIG